MIGWGIMSEFGFQNLTRKTTGHTAWYRSKASLRTGYLHIYLSYIENKYIHIPICLSIYLLIHPSIYPSIYVYINIICVFILSFSSVVSGMSSYHLVAAENPYLQLITKWRTTLTLSYCHRWNCFSASIFFQSSHSWLFQLFLCTV